MRRPNLWDHKSGYWAERLLIYIVCALFRKLCWEEIPMCFQILEKQYLKIWGLEVSVSSC